MTDAVAVPAAADMPYHRLDTLAAMRQVFELLQHQQIVMTLLAEVRDEADLRDVGGRPCGMALLTRVQPGEPLVLEVSGALPPLPPQVLALAHMPGGVRAQWVLQADWQPAAAGRWRLQAPWPAQVLQQQRRLHPRWQLPLGQSYQAGFQFGQRRCVLHLEDLSLGGVALRGTRQETAMLFMGRKIAKAVLELGSGVQVQVDLIVRSRRSYRSFLLGEQVIVGCSLEGVSDEVRAVLARITAAQNA